MPARVSQARAASLARRPIFNLPWTAAFPLSLLIRIRDWSEAAALPPRYLLISSAILHLPHNSRTSSRLAGLADCGESKTAPLPTPVGIVQIAVLFRDPLVPEEILPPLFLRRHLLLLLFSSASFHLSRVASGEGTDLPTLILFWLSCAHFFPSSFRLISFRLSSVSFDGPYCNFGDTFYISRPGRPTDSYLSSHQVFLALSLCLL